MPKENLKSEQSPAGTDRKIAVGSLVIAALSLIVAIWAVYANRTVRRLEWSLLASGPLVDVGEDLDKRFRITSENKPIAISKIGLAVLQVHNVGNEAIEKDQISESVGFVFSGKESPKILFAEFSEQRLRSQRPVINKAKNTVSLPRDLLNRNETSTINCLLSTADYEVGVVGHVAGIEEIEFRANISNSEQTGYFVPYPVYWSVTGLMGITVIVYLFGRAKGYINGREQTVDKSDDGKDSVTTETS